MQRSEKMLSPDWEKWCTQ